MTRAPGRRPASTAGPRTTPPHQAPSRRSPATRSNARATNNNNLAEICDRRLDQAVNRALTQQTTGTSAASNASWSKADRLVTNAAPWVPLVNTRTVVFVSRRVGNVQANAEWGVLIDQMWVR